jgi:hypothetical protein
MEDKKFVIVVFFAAAFLFSGYMLYAQMSLSTSQPGYFIDNSEGEPVFKQRLVWDKDEYVLKYEVVIQIFSGQYSEYYSEITDKTFIEVSLPPGKYRYSVTPYDLLGQKGDASGWEEFSINVAFQPEITKITPDFFYLDQFHERVLIISGNNIFNDSVIYLRNDENELIPVNKVVTNNSSVRLTFDDEALVPGIYEIYIKNPGGLDTFLGGFFIGYHKKFEAFLKLGYNPAIPVYGRVQEMFGTQLYYPGVTLRLELLSSERASFKAGLEFVTSFYYLNNVLNDSMDSNISMSLLDFNINISMQSRFNHLRNAISFSFGFGITSSNTNFNDLSEDLEYSSGKDQTGHVNLSVTGLFLIYRNFFFETGIDYTHYFSNASGLLKPRVGLVWRF